jgi:predicted porin
MKKQLLAAAVATAIAVPMAASADVTVYGKLHYSIDSIDYDSGISGAIPGTGNDSEAAGYDGLAVNSHSSRFGIKGSEDLGNGLSAVFQMEFGLSGDDLGNLSNSRNTYVALAGSWGVAGIGQVDTPYKSSTGKLEMFGDNIGDYNQLYFDDIRAPDALFYMSPNWNGFSFVAAVVAPSSSVNADGIEATSIAATYANGPWFATLAYEDIADDFVRDIHGYTVDYDKWRMGLGYTANGLHVGFIYEDRDLEAVGDGNSWQLSGSYTAGNNTFKVAYGEVEGMVRSTHYSTGPADFLMDEGDQWSIGVDHKLSNRTSLYAVYTDFEAEDDAVSTARDRSFDAFAVGIIHNF